MAKRRIQVQGPEALPQNSPEARPVNTFVQGQPYAPKQFLSDFSGLSQTLSMVASQRMEDKATQGKYDASVALSDPEFKKAASKDPETLRKEYNRLVQSGKIQETESPFFWEGVYRTGATDALLEYRRNVYARMDEATNAIVPGKTIDQIQAEEWDKIKDNPILSNYFAASQVGEQRPQIDQELADNAAQEYQKNAQAQTRQSKSQQAVDMLDGLTTKKVWTPEDYKSLSDLVTGWHNENIKDARGLFVDSIRVSVANMQRVSATDAKDLLGNLLDVEIAGVPLEKDAQYGPDLQALYMNLERLEKQEANERDVTAEKERGRAIRVATTEALAAAQRLRDQGLPVRKGVDDAVAVISAKLTEQGLGQYIPDAREQVETLMTRENAEGSAEVYETVMRSINAGNMTYEALQLQMDQLSPEQYNAAHDALINQESGSVFLKSPVWTNNIAGTLVNSRATAGLNADVHNDYFNDLMQDIQTRYVQLAQGIKNNPGMETTLSEFASTEVKAAREKMRTYADNWTKERQAFNDFYDKASLSSRDASAEINAARQRNLITAQEHEALLNQNRSSQSWSWMDKDRSVLYAQNTLEDMLKAAAADDGTGTPLSSQGAFVMAMAGREEFREAFKEEYSKLVGDGFSTPVQQQAAAAEAADLALQRTAKKVGIPTSLTGAQVGDVKGADKALRGWNTSLNDKDMELQAISEQAYGFNNLPMVVRDSPKVPTGFKEELVDYYNNTFRVMNAGYLDRDDIKVSAEEAIRTMWQNKAKPEDILGVAMTVGLPPQALLTGKYTYYPQIKQYVDNPLSPGESLKTVANPTNWFYGGQKSSWMTPDLNAPEEIPLGKVSLGAQTRLDFDSVLEFQQFLTENQDRIPEFMKLLGIPDEQGWADFFRANVDYINNRP